jgi:hypothetical protein
MRQRSGTFLAFLLLLAAGACVLLALPTKPSRSKSDLASTGATLPSAYSPEVENLVNKHLFLTSQEQDWAQKKMKAENTFMTPEIGSSILKQAAKPKLKSFGVDHSSDQNEDAAFNDLNRYPKQLNYNNPEQVIQGQLQDQQRQKAYDESYRQEYARQFIENARKHGYQVKLNDDLVVVSVAPIVQPTFQVPTQLPSSYDVRHPSSQQAR